MKSTFVKVAAATMAAGAALAFTANPLTSIGGRVSPPDAVEKVWAIRGADSVSTALVEGSFVLKVEPGTFNLVVDAKEPFKDKVMENVEVKEGQSLDLGEIKLEK
jgi:hypothetical protein